ncbi:MAG: hypothetical protein AB3N63_03390 [Puniceicoccaceae bacterium]
MNYQIFWEERGAVAVFKGKLAMSDLIEYQKELQGDDRYDSLDYVIADYQQADTTQIEQQDREVSLGLTIGASYSLPSLRLAIVSTDSDTTNFAKYRIAKFKEYGINWEMRIFSTLTDARKWVGAAAH